MFYVLVPVFHAVPPPFSYFLPNFSLKYDYHRRTSRFMRQYAQMSQNKQQNPIQTIVLYPRPHIDTIVAVLLMRQYGGKRFPGVEQAPIEFWTEPRDGKTAEQLLADGFLLIDMGGGEFDHHIEDDDVKVQDGAAKKVASALGIERLPEVQKLLQWAQRDEIEGKGIASKDPLDRAFGLSGLTMSLLRLHADEPRMVVDTVLPLLAAHLAQERRRYYDIPEEWAAAVQDGKGATYTMKHGDRDVTVATIETSSMEMAGYLRNNRNIMADVVIQILPTGHINVVSKQSSTIELRDIVRILRVEEGRKKGVSLAGVSSQDLASRRRIPEIPEWFYDIAANTIQNGGVVLESMEPTRLSPQEVLNAVMVGLDSSMLEKKCPPVGCRGSACYFFDFKLKRCEGRKKESGLL